MYVQSRFVHFSAYKYTSVKSKKVQQTDVSLMKKPKEKRKKSQEERVGKEGGREGEREEVGKEGEEKKKGKERK